MKEFAKFLVFAAMFISGILFILICSSIEEKEFSLLTCLIALFNFICWWLIWEITLADPSYLFKRFLRYNRKW